MSPCSHHELVGFADVDLQVFVVASCDEALCQFSEFGKSSLRIMFFFFKFVYLFCVASKSVRFCTQLDLPQ